MFKRRKKAEGKIVTLPLGFYSSPETSAFTVHNEQVEDNYAREQIKILKEDIGKLKDGLDTLALRLKEWLK